MKVTVRADQHTELLEPLSEWTVQRIADHPHHPMMDYRLKELSSLTNYQVEIFAVNDLGKSPPNHIFIFKTAEGKFYQFNAELYLLK